MTPTRTGSLSRKALAATLAAALALTTAGVAPARADNKEAIAAAALLGLIVAGIIASSRDSRAYPAHPPAVTSRKPLPAVCRFDIHRGADRGTWYGRNCLVRNNAPVWALPDRCARRVEVPRRHHEIIAYSASCLVRAGSGPAGTKPGYRGRDHDRRDRH